MEAPRNNATANPMGLVSQFMTAEQKELLEKAIREKETNPGLLLAVKYGLLAEAGKGQKYSVVLIQGEEFAVATAFSNQSWMGWIGQVAERNLEHVANYFKVVNVKADEESSLNFIRTLNQSAAALLEKHTKAITNTTNSALKRKVAQELNKLKAEVYKAADALDKVADSSYNTTTRADTVPLWKGVAEATRNVARQIGGAQLTIVDSDNVVDDAVTTASQLANKAGNLLSSLFKS